MLALSAAVIMSCQATAGQIKVVDVDTQANVSWKADDAKMMQK